LRVRDLSQHLYLQTDGSYRCFNDLIGQESFEEIEGSIPGTSAASSPATGPAPVYIFVTAHDAHAVRAFEVHAVDYLLKPYDKERFAKALVHAGQVLEQRREANRGLEPLLQSLRSLRPLERFVVKDKKRIFFYLCEAAGIVTG